MAPPHFTRFPHAKRCSSSKNSGSIRLPFMMFQASRGAFSSDIRRLAVKLDVPVLRDSCHSDNMGEQYQWEFLRIHSDLSENSAESHGNFRTWSWREKKTYLPNLGGPWTLFDRQPVRQIGKEGPMAIFAMAHFSSHRGTQHQYIILYSLLWFILISFRPSESRFNSSLRKRNYCILLHTLWT